MLIIMNMLSLAILAAQLSIGCAVYLNITTVAGSQGLAGYNADNIQGTSATLSYPSSVMSDLYNNLIITDSLNYRIRKLDVGTGILTTIAGTGTSGTSADGTEATSAKLTGPLFSAIDSNGNIYICSTGGDQVQKISAGSSKLYNFAGSGLTSSSLGDGGPATSAYLSGPRATAVDDRDNVLISERDGNRIRRVDTVGIIYAVAGTGIKTWNGDGLAATATNINSPRGLYYDASSTSIFVAETGGCRIRKFSLNSAGVYIASTFAGRAGTINGESSSCGTSGDGGVATSAQLFQPRQIVMDLNSNLYICDTDSSKIRMVTLSGIISTIAGTGTAGYNGNQAATAAMLNKPYGVWIDARDNLFIADRTNMIIRTLYSSSPTARPTGPTLAPSMLPTRVPSTSAPSTSAPTPTPTQTIAPTLEPTHSAPTAAPSPVPGNPSALPTATVAPSCIPSSTPSVFPSVSPTMAPSAAQTTVAPTVTPSLLPSTLPTPLPTSAPSPVPGDPSAAPATATPSSDPSQQPSATPSIAPSPAPTTASATEAPSSAAPETASPTSSSSSSSSGNTTTEPTLEPTVASNVHPTMDPTTSPTNSTGSLLSLDSSSSTRSFDDMTLALIITGIIAVLASVLYFWRVQRMKKGSDTAYDRWNTYNEKRKNKDGNNNGTNYESDEDDDAIHYSTNPIAKGKNKYASGKGILDALGLSSGKKKKLTFPSDAPNTHMDHESYMATIESHVDRITSAHVVDVDKLAAGMQRADRTRVYLAQQTHTLQDSTLFHATVNPLLKSRVIKSKTNVVTSGDNIEDL